MKKRFLALLVSIVVHISLFALIIYFYDIKKIVIPQTNPITPLKIALVVSPKKTQTPTTKKATRPQVINKKHNQKIPKTLVSPIILTKKIAQKTNKKYAQKSEKLIQKTITTPNNAPNKKISTQQSTPQITHTKKRTDSELDEIIRAYQQSLPQQNRPTQNNTAQKATTTKITPSILPEKVDHEAEQRYKAHLRMLISQKKHYPRRAMRTQKEGTITLSFIIYADGKIENIRLKKRSGYKILDQAAIKTIRQLSGSLPFPTRIKRKQWQFTLPIVYRLR